MKHPRNSARFSMRPVALALACMGAAPAFAQLPSWNNFQVRGGAVAVGAPTAGGTQLGIVQGTQRAIVDWQGFSIGPGHAVNIAQPGASSVLLNRVTGNELSNIAGSLNANGRVFLVNPNGVLFGNGASVNVGGLVASTLKMSTSDSAFMSGTERFEFKQDGSAFGTVENRGGITAQGGGTIALIGAQVSNSGSIVAQGGTAGLVSGDTVTVDFAGDGLTTFKVSSGLYSGVANSGVVQADGGRVVMMATAGSELAQGVVNTRGVLRADSLASRNGEIVLDSGGSAAGVTINGGLVSAAGNDAALTGGTIGITGRTVVLQPYAAGVSAATLPAPGSDDRGVIDASGGAGGGSIRLQGTAVGGIARTGAIAVAAGSTLKADATSNGDGGDIRVMGERTLRAYGTLSAKGGPDGGNGGFVETSGGYAVPGDDNNGGIDLGGVRVVASAARGKAGTWLIDPFDVTIVSGAPPVVVTFVPPVTIEGSMTNGGSQLNLDPIADNAVIFESVINTALNADTSVLITTGTGGTQDGNVTFAPGVAIQRNNSGTPVTFQIDANQNITTNGSVATINSTSGPLNVVFNAGLGGAGGIDYAGNISTNGGAVTMRANQGASPVCTICFSGEIDTRVGGTNTGGAVTLIGTRAQATQAPDFPRPVVQISDATIRTGTGNVTISGIGGLGGTGVEISLIEETTGIFTTSGNISITGVGSAFTGNTFTAPGHGVLVDGARIESVDGNIAIRGLRLAGPLTGNGVQIAGDSVVTTLGAGNIELTGESQVADAGVFIASGSTFTDAARVDGNNHVVLRAASAGGVDALTIGGIVRAGNVLNLRPGGVDASGNAGDRVTDLIGLGSTADNGFAVSAGEFSLLTAGTIVVGSNFHAGNITLFGPLSMASPLTLQNGAGGNIRLAAPITTPQLGLISAGNITQASGASIVATRLLARSTGGDVLLNDPGNNVAVGTVGGGAAGRFEYTDANAVTLGAVPVTGFDAASNLPQALPGTAVSANTVFVRTLSGDLSLATDVTSASGTDLVAGARFQNLGAYTIAGAPWRVWADTWVGETRGGLAGSGLLPNLYHCAYLGLCTVTVPAGANHFIYAQQPSAVVLVHNASRPGGMPNPLFTYSITGLILGDTGAGFAGAVSSAATQFSLPGSYPINGSFTSAEGYAVSVVPGVLTVGGLVQLIKPDVVRENQSTWLYDRNIGPAPTCLATGPLGGDRAAQGGDVLAREWSRVRSRPNLTNCIDTERRNGCADF
jgi:filamentous hemagglutinin family protein